MRPSFNPRLINGPFDDPGLFIPFMFENRAVIFDLGDISSLSPKNILKITHAFITHTHMDHFIGFDNLLRLFLGREKDLYMYGPEGFLKNVEGKLAAYTWNLVDNFNKPFTLHVTEVRSASLVTRQHMCKNRFIPVTETAERPFKGTLLKEPGLSFSSLILDHSIPCLGFSLEERFHVNIIKDRVVELGMEIGPWLREFKQALFNNNDPDSKFEAKFGGKDVTIKKFILGDLAKKIAIITPGQKITYIADVGYSKANVKSIVGFVKDSDQLFIEAAFLEKDSDIAKNKYHLTARQAGSIAGKARVKQFTLFHFSPRYTGQEELLYKEAIAEYKRSL